MKGAEGQTKDWKKGIHQHGRRVAFAFLFVIAVSSKTGALLTDYGIEQLVDWRETDTVLPLGASVLSEYSGLQC